MKKDITIKAKKFWMETGSCGKCSGNFLGSWTGMPEEC